MKKEPLFRKVNTTARGVHHLFGGDYKKERHLRKNASFDITHQSMHGKVQRGLDYTPLFRFLFSKIGKPWDQIHSEAVSRLDREEPIFWLVAMHEHERQEYVRVGEASYYSGMFVDENGLLQLVNPNLVLEQMIPQCTCCTHTLNGKPFTQPAKAV